MFFLFFWHNYFSLTWFQGGNGLRYDSPIFFTAHKLYALGESKALQFPFNIRAPNETVEKPVFQGAYNPGRHSQTHFEHRKRSHPIPDGLMERPKGVDLADIVNQGEQPPS
jgi:hypothetical protein